MPYWIYADSFLAFLIGIYIIKESISLGKETTDSLLDVSAGDKIEKEIKNISQLEKIRISNLKTQKRGSAVTANIEILLSDELPVKEAYAISENLRKKLLNKIESLTYVIIAVKNYNVTSSSYRPIKTISKLGFGSGFSWQGKGKFKDKIKEAAGQGPNGKCVCPKCGYAQEHQRGIPCSTIKCSYCNSNLERR